MKTMKTLLKTSILISVVFFSLLAGCVHSTRPEERYTILRVQNDSQNVLFSSVVSKGFKESFVGIPPGLSAGISIKTDRLGDEVTIQYSENTVDENLRSVLQTDKVSEFEEEIDEIIFRYLGNNKWVLVLVDAEGKAILPNKNGR